MERKIAVVTGATSGMGRKMAEEINDSIPNVSEIWLFGRRKDRLEALDRVLTKKTRLFPMDLQSDFSLAEYEKLLADEKPQIVFLVNAAGFGKIGTISSLSIKDQLGMIDLDMRALTALTRLSIPYLSKKSRIINFASMAAFLPQPSFAVYAACKSYVLSFSRALNEELRGTGCVVTAVCPGPVRTEFFDIAETSGRIPFYKLFFMADPDKVVRKAFRDSVTGRDISIYGASMNAFALMTKLLPHSFIFFIMRRINRLMK